MVSNDNSHHDQAQLPTDLHSLYGRSLSPYTGVIRVFLLQPNSCYESEIHGKLRELDLVERTMTSSSPDEGFEALSYTWGIEQSRNKLIIDGIAIPMKSSLETFLRRRRETDRVVPLWIDALCINQEDNEEKNHQIPVMNTIYTASETLTVWLGPADTDSDSAMENLYQLGCASPYDKIPVLPRQILESFQHLLSRPWWSRVWIIQEIVMGGLWERMFRVNVMCGEKQIIWPTLVIAAARLWSHHAERRQYFPSIKAILDLDRLRHDAVKPVLNSMSQKYSAPNLERIQKLGRYPKDIIQPLLNAARSPSTNPSASQWAISLVSEYRHFQATDARDKVYALVNMLTLYPLKSITPNYASASNIVYADFARWALEHCSGLELLRHCGTRKLDVPSWVPDWSVPQNYLPLPSKNRSRLRGAPWWSHPDVENPGGKEHQVKYFRDPLLSDPENKIARRRLEIGAKGYGYIKSLDEVPRNWGCAKDNDRLPSVLKDAITKLLDENMILFKVSNSNGRSIPNPFSSMHVRESDVLDLHEGFMTSQMHNQLSTELQDPQYQAAGTTAPDFHMNNLQLAVEGVVWDEVESVHCGFVSDVDANFEDATKFMVALGQCKAMAEDSLCAIRRLPGLEERLKSFWLCMFVGRSGMSDLRIWDMSPFERMKLLLEGPVVEYMTWLPPIPSTWNPGTAPVTATTSGLLELAERSQRIETALTRTSKIMNLTEQYITYESYRFSGLTPSDWTLDEHETYRHKFEELGLLWSEQRFDLYHTPFEFLNVIPDPYWDVRKDHDELARQKTQEYFSDMGCHVMSSEASTRDPSEIENKPEIKIITEEMSRLCKSHTSRVPRGTLGAGFEKYALGRKFFITKKGYFGLASKEVKAGDNVAVILGSDVPFILRACGRVEGKRNWQMIGEAYVDGIMDGEVLSQVDLGNVQPSMIHIS